MNKEIPTEFYGSKIGRPQTQVEEGEGVPANSSIRGREFYFTLPDGGYILGMICELCYFGPKLKYQNILLDLENNRILSSPCYCDLHSHHGLRPQHRVEEAISSSCPIVYEAQNDRVDPPYGIRLSAELVDGRQVPNGFYAAIRGFGLTGNWGCYLVDLDRKILVHPNAIVRWEEQLFKPGDDLLVPLDCISNCTF